MSAVDDDRAGMRGWDAAPAPGGEPVPLDAGGAPEAHPGPPPALCGCLSDFEHGPQCGPVPPPAADAAQAATPGQAAWDDTAQAGLAGARHWSRAIPADGPAETAILASYRAEVAAPLDYAARCERYARQRGWAYDVHAMSTRHLTPAQRRRAMRKERRSWPGWSRRVIDMPWDPRYGTGGDGHGGDD